MPPPYDPFAPPPTTLPLFPPNNASGIPGRLPAPPTFPPTYASGLPARLGAPPALPQLTSNAEYVAGYNPATTALRGRIAMVDDLTTPMMGFEPLPRNLGSMQYAASNPVASQGIGVGRLTAPLPSTVPPLAGGVGATGTGATSGGRVARTAAGIRNLPSAARGVVQGGVPGIASRAGMTTAQLGRAVGGRALLGGGIAMGIDAIRGGENSTIDQILEGGAVGGSIGSVIPGVGTLAGAGIGAAANVARNLIGGDGGEGELSRADKFASVIGSLPAEYGELFANRLVQLRGQGVGEDEAYDTLTAQAQQLVDQQFAADLARIQADTTGQLTAEDMMQLQLLAGNIMEPVAQRAEANSEVVNALYQQLAGQAQGGAGGQLGQAIGTLGRVEQLGGQTLADAYRAQAQLIPSMQQLNANIAASYQQPAAPAGLDLSAFGV